MGSAASTASNKKNKYDEDEYEDQSTSRRAQWKIMPSSAEAREKYEQEGTLTKSSTPGHLELRILLDDVVAQQTLGSYAKKCQALDIFMCWIDIQEFKIIPTLDYRRSKAFHIYHKYIKPGAVLEIGAIDSNDKDEIQQLIERAKDNAGVLSTSCYDKVQSKCFLEMYHNIFKPFRDQEDYLNLSKKLKAKYNYVRTDDFDYIGKLGEGGFGLVVHVKKKSTNKHYAMKVQTKWGLIDCFQDDPWRADFEKQAFACCRHPFIVGLDYAFQSERFAFMVLGLSTAGDLAQQLQNAPAGFLTEERVRFYAAEICLALIYLHEMGLIYRDLKPNNVLLNADGHIQLVDLGGVVDERGQVLGRVDESESLLPLMRRHYESLNTASSEHAEKCMDTLPSKNCAEDDPSDLEVKPKRKLSIMGTFGYMAPEMVVMMSQHHSEMTGYNDSVDWWSLGVTVYKLLTGVRPFTNEKFQVFVDICGTMTRHIADQAPEYAMLFQEVKYPENLSPEAVSFMERLLDVNDNKRLGSGPNGIKDIKSHPFFEGIDWELLEQKHVDPPFKPKATLDDTMEDSKWSSFETMMMDLGKEKLLKQSIENSEQKYFANWDFVSPYTLRVEFGLANEMQQYDSKFKIRRLLGK